MHHPTQPSADNPSLPSLCIAHLGEPVDCEDLPEDFDPQPPLLTTCPN